MCDSLYFAAGFVTVAPTPWLNGESQPCLRTPNVVVYYGAGLCGTVYWVSPLSSKALPFLFIVFRCFHLLAARCMGPSVRTCSISNWRISGGAGTCDEHATV